MKKTIFIFPVIYFILFFLTAEANCLTRLARLAKSEKPVFLKKEEGGLYSLTLTQPNGKEKKKRYIFENGKFISQKDWFEFIKKTNNDLICLEICYAKKGKKCFRFHAEFNENWERFDYKISGGGFFAELYLFLKGYKSGAGIVQHCGNDEFWLLDNGNLKIVFHYCKTGEEEELESIAVKINEQQASDNDI